MKVTAEQRALIAQAIAPLDTETVRDTYRRRDIPRGAMVQDIDKRFRWDLLHAANRRPRDLIAALYDAGCNDAHIDTALRSIVPPL